MRLLILLFAVAASSGCQTAQFEVDHQITGLRVAAKFEAKDRGNAWNGGEPWELLRR
jgi:hypothetical protein